ncbi:hypothetical protein DSM104299_00664 [Baekduia alba]|uniref:tetratricopeptide repeat protein n=1 Tax=Baekduia alba TaxID=2997333 RepID=UPI00233F7EEB|nr:tetratricopeptide repeat protein [Baekduia alba]WCB91983.1 hypothetical protein DSM104299_00664 [Baekduia alba]
MARLDHTSHAVGTANGRDGASALGDGAVTGLRVTMAGALLRRGRAFARAGRLEEAIATLRELLVRFGAEDAPAVVAVVHRARRQLGGALEQSGRHDEAVVVFDALLAEDRADPVAATRDALARALALHRGGRLDEAIEAYNSLDAALEGVDAGPLLVPRVFALMNVVEALAQARRDDEELDAAHDRYVAVVATDVAGTFAALRADLGERDDPAARARRAALDLKQAAVLLELGSPAVAIGLLRRLIARWEDERVPDVVRVVARARDLVARFGEEDEGADLL